jgi:hypothetical protein
MQLCQKLTACTAACLVMGAVHPHINSSSKTLHRSISELHRWDNRRQHQVRGFCHVAVELCDSGNQSCTGQVLPAEKPSPLTAAACWVKQVAVQRVDKLSHEFDGYTFAPVINDSSRRIALESYAAAPDPARPWTSSPTHINAPNIK